MKYAWMVLLTVGASIGCAQQPKEDRYIDAELAKIEAHYQIALRAGKLTHSDKDLRQLLSEIAALREKLAEAERKGLEKAVVACQDERLADLMRHSDIRTTMNVYGGGLPESMREANQKVVRMALRA